MPICSPEEMVSDKDCQKNKEKCYKHNIKPIMDGLKKLGEQFNDFKSDFKDDFNDFKIYVEKMHSKTLEEMNDKNNKFKEESDKKYASKESFKEHQKFMVKVMWTSVIAIIGFLVHTIVTLLFKFM